MDFSGNIRALWGRMVKETQVKAAATLMVEFNLTSSTYVKQTWIWGGKTPLEKQPKVVEIFQNLLKEQISESEKLTA